MYLVEADISTQFFFLHSGLDMVHLFFNLFFSHISLPPKGAYREVHLNELRCFEGRFAGFVH